MLVDGEKGDGGRVVVGSRLGGGVNPRKIGVADRRKRNRAIVDQHLFTVEEGGSRPIDELGEMLLGIDKGIVVADQVGSELLPPPQPILFALIAKALREKRVVHGRRMMLMEAVLRVRADVVEKIVELLASCVRTNKRLAAIVVEGRLDRSFPDRHHRTGCPVVAVLGQGRLVDHDSLVAAAAAGHVVVERPKSRRPPVLSRMSDALELSSTRAGNFFARS